MHNAHPTLPEFDYIKPDSLAEASQFLLAHAGESRPLLGGTDIFVRMRDGFWKDKYLVDVKGLPGIKEISFDPEKGLTIGAGVPMNRVAAHADVHTHYPLLVEAIKTVASYQLRSRATIVGNICNASPAGDTIGACMLLGGVLRVHGVDGMRDEPLTSFFLGPGKTILNPGDVVVAIFFPISPEGFQGKYIKLGRNRESDLAIVGVTVVGYPDGTTKSGFRMKLALASVAPTPLVVAEVEEFLTNNSIDLETLLKAGEVAKEACSPIDDVRGGAKYRSMMVRNLSRQALTDVWSRLANPVTSA